MESVRYKIYLGNNYNISYYYNYYVSIAIRNAKDLKMKLNSFMKLISVVSIVLITVACGGIDGRTSTDNKSSGNASSGNGSSGNMSPITRPTDNTPPNTEGKYFTIDAGSNQKASINGNITIRGNIKNLDKKSIDITDATVKSIQWLKNGSLLSSELEFTYSPTKVGTEIITFKVTDSNGKALTDTTRVTVKPTGKESNLVEAFPTNYSVGYNKELVICLPNVSDSSKLQQLIATNMLDEEHALINMVVKGSSSSQKNCKTMVKIDLKKYHLPSSIYKLNFINKTRIASKDFYVNIKNDTSKNNKIIVIQPVMTWQAYNNWNGNSLYEPNEHEKKRVSKLRPLPTRDIFHTPRMGVEALKFLKKNNIHASFYDEFDLDSEKDIFNSVKLVVIFGHSEYWTHSMRTKLEAFVKKGGNLVLAGGNTLWWKVRLDNNNNDIVINKSRAADQPGKEATGYWHMNPINNPGESFIGLTFEGSGFPVQRLVKSYAYQENFSQAEYDKSTGMHVIDPSHPIFKNTSLKKDAMFGTDIKVVDIETDGIPMNDDFTPNFTKFPKANKSMKPLAYAWTKRDHDNPIRKSILVAEMKYGQGKILNMGSIGWYHVFEHPEDVSAKILVNAINEMKN